MWLKKQILRIMALKLTNIEHYCNDLRFSLQRNTVSQPGPLETRVRDRYQPSLRENQPTKVSIFAIKTTFCWMTDVFLNKLEIFATHKFKLTFEFNLILSYLSTINFSKTKSSILNLTVPILRKKILIGV